MNLQPRPRPDRRIWIPVGRDGTEATLRIMADVARESSTVPIVRAFGHGFNNPAQAPRVLDNWMRAEWIPMPDPEDLELIRLPEYRLLDGDYRGDCDDAATFAAAVLLTVPSLRHFWRLGFVAIRMPAELEFSHVWLQCASNTYNSGGRRPFAIDIDPIVSLEQMPVRGFEETLIQLL